MIANKGGGTYSLISFLKDTKKKKNKINLETYIYISFDFIASHVLDH